MAIPKMIEKIGSRDSPSDRQGDVDHGNSRTVLHLVFLPVIYTENGSSIPKLICAPPSHSDRTGRIRITFTSDMLPLKCLVRCRCG